MRYGVWFGLAAGSSAAVLASTLAVAQAVAPTTGTAADNGNTLEEVVVTARRRVEPLQDVPVTVDAVSAAAIEARGIHTEADLQMAVPGLTVMSGNTNNILNYVIPELGVVLVARILPPGL